MVKEKDEDEEKDEDIIEEAEIISVPALRKEEPPAGLLDLTNIQGLSVDEFDKVVKDLIEKVKRYSNYALRMTTERDWTNQGGQPFMASSGAEKIRKLFGINVRIETINKEMREDKIGKFYIYTVQGFAGTESVGMPAIGTCSSRDKLFGYTRSGGWRPLEEISETNIKKKAISNFEGNAIKRYLGLRNLSWEELEKAGLNKDAIKKVHFKGEQDDDEDFSGSNTKKEKRIEAIKKLIDKTSIPKRAKDGMKNLLPTLNEKGMAATERKVNKFMKLNEEVVEKLYKLPKKFRDTLLKDDRFLEEDVDEQLKDIEKLRTSLHKSAWEKGKK